jgi:hypothetical protein
LSENAILTFYRENTKNSPSYYDRPVRGTVVMGRMKLGANLVFARFIMKFSILRQPENT